MQPFVDAAVVVELAQRPIHEAGEVLQLFPCQGGEPRGEQQAALAAHVGLDLAGILGELQGGIVQRRRGAAAARRAARRGARQPASAPGGSSRTTPVRAVLEGERGARRRKSWVLEPGPEQVQRLCRGLGDAGGGSGRGQLPERVGKDGA